MSPQSLFFAHYYTVLEYFAAVTALIILLSSIDDLFIDAWYWTRVIYRKLVVTRQPDYKPLQVEDLQRNAEQPLAIMVPAWMEHDVIAQMLENMVNELDYRNYVIFVGTYANDAATIGEVERMRRRYRQLRRVEVPHDGPTCKADCLNWVMQSILLYEQQEKMVFAGMILHDSEDVVHPLELKFFNYLLPRKDMIQLPVMSIEREWHELVAGTYMDEFAEWHAKDLVVRESVSGMVPSAGVGTCFSRRAMLALCKGTHNQPFNPDSLTEDYDVGTRLGRMGMQSIFARFNVQYRITRKTWFGLGGTSQALLTIPLCVREYFPNTLSTAYRQKARWILGIGMQNWQQNGWQGPLWVRYLLFRDRKGIVTSFVSILAYILLLQFVVYYIADMLGWEHLRLPPVFGPDSWLTLVLQLTAIALLLRVVQRVYFVSALYGAGQGLLSMPRMVIGNVVNFLAVSRAWRIFLGHLFYGKPMVWDKTMHDFPSTEQLSQQRMRLGELLSTWQAVDSRNLAAALDDQRVHQMPLGRILVSKGWLDDETLAEAIAFQSELPRIALDPAMVAEGAPLLPSALCVRWRVLPIARDSRGRLQVAVANPLSDAALQQIGDAAPLAQDGPVQDLDTPLAHAVAHPVDVPLGAVHGERHGVAQFIVRESEINAGLRLLAGASLSGATPLLGDILIEAALISRAAFDAALTQYRPDRDGRIGDYLVRIGVVSHDAIDYALEQQRRRQAAAAVTGALNPSETA
ncbi:glycosyl transferase family protein [Pseudoduganella sp. FT26W]|uniref:Glycosyl transferase family protein n=1 Tax=Duganella aquatilis TaxID=2666082 RepID=A0A844CZC1_9BURK|nr:glycosyl transferase family protein [Duganella aquatilis]MRW82855.1 glycosyl transferase family protein [Duganella aquatilis]